MNTFSRFTSAIIEKGRRVLKVLQYDVKTVNEAMPFGEDSIPLKDMIAIYAETSENSDSVIVGYINENQLPKVKEGEKRLYSLKPDGSLSFEIYLKGDGTIEIGGNQFSAVKYEPLDAALKAQDVLINAELAKIATVLNTLLPGSYVLSPVSTNPLLAKSNTIKVSI